MSDEICCHAWAKARQCVSVGLVDLMFMGCRPAVAGTHDPLAEITSTWHHPHVKLDKNGIGAIIPVLFREHGMNTNDVRAAIYLRVSRDDQTTENQRLVLARVAEHRGWLIVQTYADQGISGAKGREQRPAFDAMLKDAVRRRYDILLVWSIDRLGRSVLHVANALAELDAAGIRLYCDREGIDSSTPMGRAMIQMASVFGEQERSILRSRVLAGLERVRAQGGRLGRPKVSPKVENAIRTHLSAGKGILKVAALVGVGSGTVQRVRREMGDELAVAA
jgi:DNA invertase Pin-like site-specific DNA recombinase